MSDLIPQQSSAERLYDEGPLIEVGQWYWHGEKLGCIVHIGSNYVELSFPTRYHSDTERVHLNEFDKLILENNPNQIIQDKVDFYKNKVENNLKEIKMITARLGVSTRVGIINRHDAPQASSRALSSVSQNQDPNKYKNDLIQAKEKELPALFREMKENNELLSVWLCAESIPLQAISDSVEGCIEEVKDRIFSVSLYAGLTENVTQFAEGEPADYGDKLHIMQRRCYMDEECLLDYQAGGMDFKNLGEFNKWLAKPNNRDRILPFPRCIVAFRIRRVAKEREHNGLLSKFIQICDEEKIDTQTYLYIRNGDRLYFLRSKLEFGGNIFPDPGMCDPNVPLMVARNFGNIEFMSVNEYKQLCSEYKQQKDQYEKEKKERDEWFKDNVGPKPQEKDFVVNNDGTVTFNKGKFSRTVTCQQAINNTNFNAKDWAEDPCEVAYVYVNNEIWRKKCDEAPYGGYLHNNRFNFNRFNPDKWSVFDQNTVYYDDGLKQIADKIKHYNRIALIVQGLFDRSEVLHPHPPARTWTAEGFESAVTLVYDQSNTLHDGDKPNFEAYWAKCNESLGPNAITIGQDTVWTEKMAEKENIRQERDYRIQRVFEYTRYRPYGNPGPGKIARIFKWMPKARKAKFTWFREALSWNAKNSHIYTTITVDANDLFCVDGYKKGDFLQFFKDPRTRAEYIKWAPFLLTAEDYLAGKIKVQEPVNDID